MTFVHTSKDSKCFPCPVRLALSCCIPSLYVVLSPEGNRTLYIDSRKAVQLRRRIRSVAACSFYHTLFDPDTSMWWISETDLGLDGRSRYGTVIQEIVLQTTSKRRRRMGTL